MLFDTSTDPLQLHNLFTSAAHTDLRRKLHSELLTMLRQSGETAPEYILRHTPGSGK